MPEPITQEDKQEPKPKQLSPEQIVEWGDSVSISEPPVKDEAGNTLDRSQRLPTNAEVGTDEKKPDEEEETPEDGKALPEPEPIPSIVTAEDPGTFTPTDYSFEVTIFTGEEGKEKAKTVKISSPEDADTLLDSDPNFGGAKELLAFNRKVLRMESNTERDLRDYENKKTTFEQQNQSEVQRQESISNIANEIQYLVGKGKLPKAADQYANADWSDKEIANKPGVKEQIALLNYMSKENAARTKAGLKPMTSVLDAYNAWIVDDTEQKNVERSKQAGVQRKAAGAKVAGSSPAPTSVAPKGISVGRGGSLRDLNSGWGF